MPAGYVQLPRSSSVRGEGGCLEMRMEGEVWVRYADRRNFERAWFSLAVDDSLTVRSERDGPVLRTASTRLCQVSKVKSPPPLPYERAITVMLRQCDSRGCRVYVISHGDLPDQRAKGGKDPSAHSTNTCDELPLALRQWHEAFSTAASRLSGVWKWQFAVIFGLINTNFAGDDGEQACALTLAKDALHELVENWCVSFQRWHFEVAIAERTEQTKDRIIILLHMDDSNIEKYFRALEIERWQRSADRITLRRESPECDATIDVRMTMQARVATMAHVLS